MCYLRAIWGFLKWGSTQVWSSFSLIFHDKLSSYLGSAHLWKPPIGHGTRFEVQVAVQNWCKRLVEEGNENGHETNDLEASHGVVVLQIGHQDGHHLAIWAAETCGIGRFMMVHDGSWWFMGISSRLFSGKSSIQMGTKSITMTSPLVSDHRWAPRNRPNNGDAHSHQRRKAPLQ